MMNLILCLVVLREVFAVPHASMNSPKQQDKIPVAIATDIRQLVTELPRELKKQILETTSDDPTKRYNLNTGKFESSTTGPSGLIINKGNKKYRIKLTKKPGTKRKTYAGNRTLIQKSSHEHYKSSSSRPPDKDTSSETSQQKSTEALKSTTLKTTSSKQSSTITNGNTYSSTHKYGGDGTSEKVFVDDKTEPIHKYRVTTHKTTTTTHKKQSKSENSENKYGDAKEKDHNEIGQILRTMEVSPEDMRSLAKKYSNLDIFKKEFKESYDDYLLKLASNPEQYAKMFEEQFTKEVNISQGDSTTTETTTNKPKNVNETETLIKDLTSFLKPLININPNDTEKLLLNLKPATNNDTVVKLRNGKTIKVEKADEENFDHYGKGVERYIIKTTATSIEQLQPPFYSDENEHTSTLGSNENSKPSNILSNSDILRQNKHSTKYVYLDKNSRETDESYEEKAKVIYSPNRPSISSESTSEERTMEFTHKAQPKNNVVKHFHSPISPLREQQYIMQRLKKRHNDTVTPNTTESSEKSYYDETTKIQEDGLSSSVIPITTVTVFPEISGDNGTTDYNLNTVPQSKPEDTTVQTVSPELLTTTLETDSPFSESDKSPTVNIFEATDNLPISTSDETTNFPQIENLPTSTSEEITNSPQIENLPTITSEETTKFPQTEKLLASTLDETINFPQSEYLLTSEESTNIPQSEQFPTSEELPNIPQSETFPTSEESTNIPQSEKIPTSTSEETTIFSQAEEPSYDLATDNKPDDLQETTELNLDPVEDVTETQVSPPLYPSNLEDFSELTEENVFLLISKLVNDQVEKMRTLQNNNEYQSDFTKQIFLNIILDKHLPLLIMQAKENNPNIDEQQLHFNVLVELIRKYPDFALIIIEKIKSVNHHVSPNNLIPVKNVFAVIDNIHKFNEDLLTIKEHTGSDIYKILNVEVVDTNLALRILKYLMTIKPQSRSKITAAIKNIIAQSKGKVEIDIRIKGNLQPYLLPNTAVDKDNIVHPHSPVHKILINKIPGINQKTKKFSPPIYKKKQREKFNKIISQLHPNVKKKTAVNYISTLLEPIVNLHDFNSLPANKVNTQFMIPDNGKQEFQIESEKEWSIKVPILSKKQNPKHVSETFLYSSDIKPRYKIINKVKNQIPKANLGSKSLHILYNPDISTKHHGFSPLSDIKPRHQEFLLMAPKSHTIDLQPNDEYDHKYFVFTPRSIDLRPTYDLLGKANIGTNTAKLSIKRPHNKILNGDQMILRSNDNIYIPQSSEIYGPSSVSPKVQDLKTDDGPHPHNSYYFFTGSKPEINIPYSVSSKFPTKYLRMPEGPHSYKSDYFSIQSKPFEIYRPASLSPKFLRHHLRTVIRPYYYEFNEEDIGNNAYFEPIVPNEKDGERVDNFYSDDPQIIEEKNSDYGNPGNLIDSYDNEQPEIPIARSSKGYEYTDNYESEIVTDRALLMYDDSNKQPNLNEDEPTPMEVNEFAEFSDTNNPEIKEVIKKTLADTDTDQTIPESSIEKSNNNEQNTNPRAVSSISNEYDILKVTKPLDTKNDNVIVMIDGNVPNTVESLVDFVDSEPKINTEINSDHVIPEQLIVTQEDVVSKSGNGIERSTSIKPNILQEILLNSDSLGKNSNVIGVNSDDKDDNSHGTGRTSDSTGLNSDIIEANFDDIDVDSDGKGIQFSGGTEDAIDSIGLAVNSDGKVVNSSNLVTNSESIDGNGYIDINSNGKDNSKFGEIGGGSDGKYIKPECIDFNSGNIGTNYESIGVDRSSPKPLNSGVTKILKEVNGEKNEYDYSTPAKDLRIKSSPEYTESLDSDVAKATKQGNGEKDGYSYSTPTEDFKIKTVTENEVIKSGPDMSKLELILGLPNEDSREHYHELTTNILNSALGKLKIYLKKFVNIDVITKVVNAVRADMQIKSFPSERSCPEAELKNYAKKIASSIKEQIKKYII